MLELDVILAKICCTRFCEVYEKSSHSQKKKKPLFNNNRLVALDKTSIEYFVLSNTLKRLFVHLVDYAGVVLFFFFIISDSGLDTKRLL